MPPALSKLHLVGNEAATSTVEWPSQADFNQWWTESANLQMTSLWQCKAVLKFVLNNDERSPPFKLLDGDKVSGTVFYGREVRSIHCRTIEASTPSKSTLKINFSKTRMTPRTHSKHYSISSSIRKIYISKIMQFEPNK